MSAESSFKNKVRPLKQEELGLLRAILKGTRFDQALSSTAQVRELDDGGMGSIEFLCESNVQQRKAECIAEADYMDSDGVPVSIAVNIDQHGRLFELDIWKVDFRPLRTYPTAQTIRNVRPAK